MLGAASGLVSALLHTKGKLVKMEPGGGGSSGALGKLGNALNSMSPIPIPMTSVIMGSNGGRVST